MKKPILIVVAIASCTWQYGPVGAQEANQTPRGERQEQRQEARQEAQAKRQDARQDARQDTRQDRRQERQARTQQRLDNRGQYYDNQALSDMDPWIQRNKVAPLDRLSNAAGAAVNAAEKALNTANNAGNALGGANTNARYGYVNPNGPGEAGWFYDYYSYSPTYYNAPATGSTVYGSATRYYDLNNDGVYDSLNIFRDSDNNASYDVYDRYDFAIEEESKQSQSAEELLDSPEDANRHTVTGKIYASKSAKVNGIESLIVRLSDTQDKESITIVDVGPLEDWKQRSYKSGDQLTATGPVERVGDKQILIAESVTLADKKEIQIVRGSPKLEGQVVDITKAKVKGAEHTLAVVKSESKRQLVDLGRVKS